MSVNLAQAIAATANVWPQVKAGTLTSERAIAKSSTVNPQMRAAVQSVLLATIRKRAQSDWIINKLVPKEPSVEVAAILQVALSLLLTGREKPFLVVDQAVVAAKSQEATLRAAGFINAVLRNYLRGKDTFTQQSAKNLNVRFNAPGWWISKVRASHPNHWQSILETQTKHPPLTLRINRSKVSMSEYLAMLEKAGVGARQISPWGVIIDPPRPVAKIPGFSEGFSSVQDAGSQLVTDFLPLKDGMRILDACAAPGGKTAQMLETFDLDVTALEIDPVRAKKLQETLDRLKLKANVVVGSAADDAFLATLGEFDAILLDAPCTASGIVRRHPDIPWSRRPEDISQLAATQAKILEALWKILPAGKKLLYVVCSIFPEEGPQQIEGFLKRHAEARLMPLGEVTDGMLPLLPTEQEANEKLPRVHDGFFYALLEKMS